MNNLYEEGDREGVKAGFLLFLAPTVSTILVLQQASANPEGLVQKTIDKKSLAWMFWRVYPIYVVPKNRLKRIEEIRERKEI